jgi:hypothetical protein
MSTKNHQHICLNLQRKSTAPIDPASVVYSRNSIFIIVFVLYIIGPSPSQPVQTQFDFDKDVENQMRILEESLKEMMINESKSYVEEPIYQPSKVSIAPNQDGRIPIDNNHYQNSFHNNYEIPHNYPPDNRNPNNGKPFSYPSEEPVNLSEWKYKGYPSEYAYAKDLGLLDAKHPKNNEKNNYLTSNSKYPVNVTNSGPNISYKSPRDLEIERNATNSADKATKQKMYAEQLKNQVTNNSILN